MFIDKLRKLQNSFDNLKRLAAQRYLYSKAKKINILNFIISVVIPIGLAFFQKKACIKNFTCLYSVLIILIQYFLIAKFKQKFQKNASQIQLLFDLNVFDLKWDSKFLGSRLFLDTLIVREAQKYLKKHDISSLKDWYCLAGLNKLKKHKLIKACQNQNIQWNNTSHKKIITIVVVTIILLFLISVIYGFIYKYTIEEIFGILVTYIPLLTWLLSIYSSYKRDIEKLTRIKNLLKSDDCSKITLLIIEDKITDYRQNCILIPDMIYKVFRNADNQTIEEAQQIKD